MFRFRDPFNLVERPTPGMNQSELTSLMPTRLVLAVDVAIEFRAVVVGADGAVRILDARVDLPDGARAMLLAAAWGDGNGILDAVREVGAGCLRRAGAERLLALATTTSKRVGLRASVDDVRRVLCAAA